MDAEDTAGRSCQCHREAEQLRPLGSLDKGNGKAGAHVQWAKGQAWQGLAIHLYILIMKGSRDPGQENHFLFGYLVS